MSLEPEPSLDAWLRHARMASLLLADAPGGHEPRAVVEWFGAMQAQDLASVTWSLGVRTGSSRAEVTRALADGSIVRTWPMRGTLHLVPGRDARWMVRHLAQRSLKQAAARRAALGLDEATAERACALLATSLGADPVGRADCLAMLSEAGFSIHGQRGYHLLWYAAARGLICVGPSRGREQTFVLMEGWAPPGPAPDRSEALSLLAERFVRSHGPITVHDFARWANLTVAEARTGLAESRGVVERAAAGRRFLLTEELLDRFGPPPDPAAPARRGIVRGSAAGTRPGATPATLLNTGAPRAWALPGFDEFVLGYRDRAAQLEPDRERLVVPGGNGFFRPTLVLAGRVVGTWRRREMARRVIIEPHLFDPLDPPATAGLERALAAYAEHLGLPGEVRWYG